MALPTSGTINLSDLQTQFGGSNPVSMSEYYRGGSNVANNAINTNIPTSGTLDLTDFYGTAGTQTRSLQVKMDYGFYNSATGLTTQSSTASPSTFGVGTNSIVYQPVFHAGTGFITSASLTIQQNEDVASNSEHVLLYGGTNSSNVTNIVCRWDAGSSGSQGGNRTYTISWDADGKIGTGGAVYQSGVYNQGIISLVTNDASGARTAGYTWWGLRIKNPSSWSKGSEILLGTFYGTSNYTQPS